VSRRKKIIEHVRIEAVASEGKGLARHDGRVIFVDYGIPGDVVNVRLTRNKKDYAVGIIQDVIQPSALRQEPFCRHFGTCGGCRWQHISYDRQLGYKQGVVEEAFRRIGKQEDYELLPIAGCERTTAYRNKFEFTFSGRGWFTKEQIRSGEALERKSLGFHVAGQHQKVVHIDYCHLQEEEGNAIRQAVYHFALDNGISFYDQVTREGLLRNLTMRLTSPGERMILVSFGENDADAIEKVMAFVAGKYPGVRSVNYVVNTKWNDTIYDLEVVNYAGSDHIIEHMGDIAYRIGPKSFFQTNSEQAHILYDIAVRFAELQPSDLVYDLYTGIGSIALYIARSCKHVVGVETVPEAIVDAWKNAELNGITNVDFVAGSSERILDQGFLDQYGSPDVIITDPPRAGMHADVIDFILKASPARIVYVSCNPVTQARDILMLAPAYRLEKIQPVDMFPHTYHIENVALLRKRS
jgi:23S rRNA (uracil1939-C5)-methyltransferase